MSHYITLVMLNEEEIKDASTAIEKKLEPYDENKEVPSYKKACSCIEWGLTGSVLKQLEEEGQDIDGYRDSFTAKREEILEQLERSGEQDNGKFYEMTNEAWKIHIAPYLERKKEIEDSLRPSAEHNPDCDDCHGSGIYTTTYNPDSKWDWYTIGGRWNGYFNEGSGNIAPVSKAIEMGTDAVPFAVVSPDGWHERGQMHFFAIVSEEKEEDTWQREVMSLYEKYPDHYLVAVDCHI